MVLARRLMKSFIPHAQGAVMVSRTHKATVQTNPRQLAFRFT